MVCNKELHTGLYLQEINASSGLVSGRREGGYVETRLTCTRSVVPGIQLAPPIVGTAF